MGNSGFWAVILILSIILGLCFGGCYTYQEYVTNLPRETGAFFCTELKPSPPEISGLGLHFHPGPKIISSIIGRKIHK